MSDLQVFVSTSQAAQILDVHESSIKRWSNDNLIPVKLTRGGHRRLDFREVLEFGRSQGTVSPLDSFAPDELTVWQAIQESSRNRFDEVRRLLFDATDQNRESFALQLTLLLIDSGVSVNSLFDNIFGPVLRTIGDEWLAGTITTGDEHRMTQILGDCIAAVRNKRPIVATERPLAVVACAPGENHELGALMVRTALEYSGWRTVYLGRNVPAEDIISQQLKWDVQLVCVSFIPPHGPADALMLVRALTRMYDEAHPFSLALGGGNLLVKELNGMEHPFVRLSRFTTIADFTEWSDDLSRVLTSSTTSGA